MISKSGILIVNVYAQQIHIHTFSLMLVAFVLISMQNSLAVNKSATLLMASVKTSCHLVLCLAGSCLDPQLFRMLFLSVSAASPSSGWI